MDVELAMKVADFSNPPIGMVQTAVLTLLGIHSMKLDEFLSWKHYNRNVEGSAISQKREPNTDCMLLH
jgi:hypothetical protein